MIDNIISKYLIEGSTFTRGESTKLSAAFRSIEAPSMSYTQYKDGKESGEEAIIQGIKDDINIRRYEDESIGITFNSKWDKQIIIKAPWKGLDISKVVNKMIDDNKLLLTTKYLTLHHYTPEDEKILKEFAKKYNQNYTIGDGDFQGIKEFAMGDVRKYRVVIEKTFQFMGKGDYYIMFHAIVTNRGRAIETFHGNNLKKIIDNIETFMVRNDIEL